MDRKGCGTASDRLSQPLGVSPRRNRDIDDCGWVASMQSTAGAVRPRDDLEVVSVRIAPVQAATAVVAVDLAGLSMIRIGPVGKATIDDARVDRVEVGFAHEERVVLGENV